MKKPKRMLSALAVLTIILMSGCSEGSSIFSGRVELSTLQVIQTLALDVADGGGVIVTAVSSQGADGSPPVVISKEGDSIQQAIEKIQDFSTMEQLFFPHISKILIGEKAAREGIREFLDYFERIPRVKLSTEIFIVRNGLAKDLVTQASSSSETDISAILESVKKDAEKLGKGWVYTTADIAKNLAGSGCALVCAVDTSPVEGIIFSEHPPVTATPAGYAIIKKARLTGFIPPEMARGVNLIHGKLKGGSVEAVSGKSHVILELISGSVKFTPVWESENLLTGVIAKVDVRAGISSMTGDGALNAGLVDSLREQLGDNISGLVRQVLELSKAQRADFLGLGSEIERGDPARWSEISPQWEEIIGNLSFEVDASSKIDRSYDLVDSVGVAGRGNGNDGK